MISIKKSNVVIKNLSIENSGFSVEKIDSAIHAKEVNNITIENNHISDSFVWDKF